ncbi:MAG: hypothetical protein QXM16_01530 [Nitrososphaerota archaeon]
MDSTLSRLREFLEGGRDWERKRTSIPGVFLLKIPGTRLRPAELAVEINPVDSSGTPRKRRGLILRGYQDLEDFRKIINDERLSTLVEMLQQVNPTGERSGREGEDVIDI